MPFIFNRPQEEIVPLETLLRIRREAFIGTIETPEVSAAQRKAIDERLDKLLDLLQEIEESQK